MVRARIVTLEDDLHPERVIGGRGKGLTELPKQVALDGAPFGGGKRLAFRAARIAGDLSTEFVDCWHLLAGEKIPAAGRPVAADLVMRGDDVGVEIPVIISRSRSVDDGVIGNAAASECPGAEIAENLLSRMICDLVRQLQHDTTLEHGAARRMAEEFRGKRGRLSGPGGGRPVAIDGVPVGVADGVCERLVPIMIQATDRQATVWLAKPCGGGTTGNRAVVRQALEHGAERFAKVWRGTLGKRYAAALQRCAGVEFRPDLLTFLECFSEGAERRNDG